MRELKAYLDIIVDPTVRDFTHNPTSVRHCFLACLTVSHCVDRVAGADIKKTHELRELWKRESNEFYLVQICANHLKHGEIKAIQEARKEAPDTLNLYHALGIDEAGTSVDVRNLHFIIRDAVAFVRNKAAQ